MNPSVYGGLHNQKANSTINQPQNATQGVTCWLWREGVGNKYYRKNKKGVKQIVYTHHINSIASAKRLKHIIVLLRGT